MQQRLIVLCTVLICLTSAVFSQRLSFTSYTSSNNLSQNSGYCMAQDGLGYMWMGTQDGLNKFNGKKIITYYKENVIRGRLADNFIKALYYDSLNNWLWIGTASGLSIYNIRADSFYAASNYFTGADTLNGLMINSIVPGRSPAEILVLTASEGMFICNTGLNKAKQFFQGPGTKNRTQAATVWNNEILVVANKNLYRLTDTPVIMATSSLLEDIRQLQVWQDKLWAASTKSGVLVLENLNTTSISTFNCGSSDVGVFATDKYNNLWIGTRTAGIVIIEPTHFSKLYDFASAANQNEWPKKFTLSLLKDRQNNMWAGSSGGGFSVHYSTKKEFGLIRKSEEQFGKAAHNMILSIYKAAGPSIYAGTQLEGLLIADVQTNKIDNIYNPDRPAANAVYRIDSSSQNTLWLATLAGLYQFDIPAKKFTHFIDSNLIASTKGQLVYKLRDHDSLLYSSNLGTVFFDLKNKRFRPLNFNDKQAGNIQLVIQQAMEDDNGNVWMGSSSNGLVKYNLAKGEISIPITVKHFSKTVNAIFIDGHILWAGTNNGILAYDLVAERILKTFTVANGLPGNVIYSIEKDSQGSLWCGSNAGLVKIDNNSNKITQVKASAGLQGDEFNTACSAHDSAGNLYFGGINGISFFNPAKFTIDQFSPQPLVESIKIANKEIDLSAGIQYTDEIQLSYQQNFITLEFGVNNFINHDECLYKYKLEGADADWVFSGTRSFVNYAGLTPGKYVFYLLSSNSSGIWSSNPAKLILVISPAWWQTWWFFVAAALSVFAMLLFMVRKRIAEIRYRAETKHKITETEMAALKAQMNPHFMFNCINSIDAFIHSNDKYNATLYLNKFAKLLRNILDSSKQNTVLLSKDLDTLKLYIELEELRHEKKFQSNITVDNELLNSDYKVPPLIIQPFVENAILHGLKNKAGNDGLLFVTIKKVNDRIQYVIEDNGIGRRAAGLIPQTKESSYGMDMSVERIKLFNGEQNASVEIIDLQENGTAAGTKIIVYLKIN